MSLVTPDTIQTLQRKLCLKAKRGSQAQEWAVAGSADPRAHIYDTLGVNSPTAQLATRARVQKEPGPRAGCGKSARPVR